MMEMYIEKGETRMECELKIAAKYNRPFRIVRQKDVALRSFLGIFSKPGVQVEFVFSPPLGSPMGSPMGSPASLHNQGMLNTGMLNAQNTHQLNSNFALEENKRKVLAAASEVRQSVAQQSEIAAKGKEASQEILDTLKELMEKIEGKNDEHHAFIRVTELLRANDFSEKYIKEMLERLRKELSFEQLEDHSIVQDHLLEWIGESISIYDEEKNGYTRKPKIMVFVGPTGVGKTTTLSKLAAIYGVIGSNGVSAVDVRTITIDAFRIGAKEQLEQTMSIMQIPVCCVDNKQDLRKEIALQSENADMFLIDTIGKSPGDASKVGEMKEILEGAGRNADFHLVIAATTRTSDIENIMRQFEQFNYKSVIFTKLDETDRIGNLISALAEKRKPVSYITDGQAVPVDIQKASVVRFLINLEGFKINRKKIEERFPPGEIEQFK